MKVLSLIYKVLLIAFICTALYQEIFANGVFIKGAFYYFTIQSNILVVFCLMIFVFIPTQSRTRCLLRGISLLAITLTAIIYNFVLYKIYLDWGTVGYTFSRTTTHVIAPVGFILDWLLFDRHNIMKWKDIIVWLLYPAIYTVFSFYMVFRYGFSVYFFFNINNGYAGSMKWMLILLCVLLLISFSYVGIDKLLVRKKDVFA